MPKLPEQQRQYNRRASMGALREVELAMHMTWPEELRAFYQLQNGEFSDSDAVIGSVLPAQELFDIDRVLADHAMMVEVWAALANNDATMYPGGYENISLDNPTAGTRVDAFVPAYIPVSGSDGYYYFCDTRPGEHWGCIRAFDRDDADEAGPKWDSIADLLQAVRLSIIHRLPLDGWAPSIVDEALIWRPAALVGDPFRTAVAPVNANPGASGMGNVQPQVSLSGQFETADRDALARAVLEVAADRHPGRLVEGGDPAIQRIPNTPGFTAGCIVFIDGEPVSYTTTITDGRCILHRSGGARTRTDSVGAGNRQSDQRADKGSFRHW